MTECAVNRSVDTHTEAPPRFHRRQGMSVIQEQRRE